MTTEEHIYDDPKVLKAMIETVESLPISGEWQAERRPEPEPELRDIMEGSATTEHHIPDDPKVKKNAKIEAADNLLISGEWQAGQQQSVCTALDSDEDGEQWVRVYKD